ACVAAGRDPETLERTVAMLFQLDGGGRRRLSTNPVTGSVGEMTEALHRVADTGIDEVQLVLDPIDERSIDTMAEVLASFRS
ncbi:MAG: hypothetical protein R3246_12530, partial [Acidimicrobiia bacterium]|nr:hypothetical protein [Acidimicrobiia bacterium]